MKILYGTTNKAKLLAMRHAVEMLGIDVIGLNDIKGERPTIKECGKTPLENAQQKAKAYYQAFRIPVFSCDSGLYFDELKEEEQPGVYVRRINGRELSDDDRNAICFVWDENHCYSSMDPSIATEPFLLSAVPHPKRVRGFPLDSLSIDLASGQYYYNLGFKDVSSSVDDGVRVFFQKVLSEIKKNHFFE